MSTINQLNAVDQISGSDLLALFSQANGDTRKMSLTNFATWLEDQEIATQDNKITQYAAPTNGATVVISDTQNGVWLILSPAGTIAGATLKFPLSSTTLDRTEILINTTNAITTITNDANGGTIEGAVTTLAAKGFLRYRFDIVLQTWYRVG